MQISKRLEAVAGMVTPGLTLADVGTDHAYIPIYLIENQTVPHAVAMDIGRGPLARAQEHIGAHGLEAQIETRLSDGLEALTPGEVQSIVIAGMGGPLAVRILTMGAAQAAACREVILQPQSELRLVRSYLGSAGYRIVQEELVCEEGKFYPMMKCVPEAEQCGNEKPCQGPDCVPEGHADGADVMAEPEHCGNGKPCRRPDCMPDVYADGTGAMAELGLRFGPLLLARRHPVLREYLLRERRLNSQILEALSGQEGERAAARRAEVEQEQAYVEQALALYEGEAWSEESDGAV